MPFLVRGHYVTLQRIIPLGLEMHCEHKLSCTRTQHGDSDKGSNLVHSFQSPAP